MNTAVELLGDEATHEYIKILTYNIHILIYLVCMSFSAKTQFSTSSCKKKKKLEIVICACLDFLRCLLKLIQ